MSFKTHFLAGVALICLLSSSGFGQFGCPGSTLQNCSSCVVVANDTLRDCLTDGQPVTFAMQAYFNGNEEVNVWLTSPCAGNIVGLHIFWRSPGGVPPQLEESLTIYDDSGTFPNRSNTPLNHVGVSTFPAIFGSPQMLDGGINEFTQIGGELLRVPVTAGQTFVVSFDFFNNICNDTCTPNCFDPDPVCSGPTIGIDTDGCQLGQSSVDSQFGVIDPCAFGMAGDFIIRAIIECASAAGACCLPDGTCDFISPEDCAIQQGEFQGAAVTCGSVTCLPLVGACCTTAPLACTNTTEGDCLISGGTWLGSIANGFDCNIGDPCNLQGLGGCCTGVDSCWFEQVSQDFCVNVVGGTWAGLGTDCNDNISICTPTGACCFEATGACVDDLTDTQCTSGGLGFWLGEGTVCGGGNPDLNCFAPCPADCALGGDGNVNVTDLLQLLSDWGTAGACDMANGGDGTVNVTDLLALLAAWGPCP